MKARVRVSGGVIYSIQKVFTSQMIVPRTEFIVSCRPYYITPSYLSEFDLKWIVQKLTVNICLEPKQFATRVHLCLEDLNADLPILTGCPVLLK